MGPFNRPLKSHVALPPLPSPSLRRHRACVYVVCSLVCVNLPHYRSWNCFFAASRRSTWPNGSGALATSGPTDGRERTTPSSRCVLKYVFWGGYLLDFFLDFNCRSLCVHCMASLRGCWFGSCGVFYDIIRLEMHASMCGHSRARVFTDVGVSCFGRSVVVVAGELHACEQCAHLEGYGIGLV